MDCPQCKTENPADARFCYRCGSTFGEPGAEPATSEPDSGTLLAITPPEEAPPAQPGPGSPDRPAVRPADAPKPQKLGYAGAEKRYELLEIIGRGGMGAVYRAQDRNLGRVVALKRVRQVGDSETAWQRFTREAQSIARMQHPNIVTVHDFGRDADGPFLVMEYVEGETLATRLARRGALPPAQIAGILEGICAGVAHAHEKGVTHRDIKPANVMIDARGVPKLLDFGLAREGTGSEMSQTGWFLGTPDYAAPEQKVDAKSVDHRADIYALGAMLYELLSGNRPVPLLLSKLPLHWQFVVGKACEPEPGDRYQSVADLLEVVRNIPLDARPSVPAPPKQEVNELSCPDCGADNTVEARKCGKCGASLDTTCALCGGRRRVGMRTCTSCKANVYIAGAALAHRDRAKRALEGRLLREACEELTELEFILTRSSEQLGPANEWFPWVRENLSRSKQRIESSRKLAEKGRESDRLGMVGAALRKMAQAAALDARYMLEYEQLAERAGIAPEQRRQQLAQAETESSQPGGGGNTMTMGARGVRPSSPVNKEAMLTRVNLKVRCNACNVGILTRQEVLEKTKACPKCGAAPFEWHAESQA